MTRLLPSRSIRVKKWTFFFNFSKEIFFNDNILKAKNPKWVCHIRRHDHALFSLIRSFNIVVSYTTLRFIVNSRLDGATSRFYVVTCRFTIACGRFLEATCRFYVATCRFKIAYCRFYIATCRFKIACSRFLDWRFCSLF